MYCQITEVDFLYFVVCATKTKQTNSVFTSVVLNRDHLGKNILECNNRCHGTSVNGVTNFHKFMYSS